MNMSIAKKNLKQVSAFVLILAMLASFFTWAMPESSAANITANVTSTSVFKIFDSDIGAYKPLGNGTPLWSYGVYRIDIDWKVAQSVSVKSGDVFTIPVTFSGGVRMWNSNAYEDPNRFTFNFTDSASNVVGKFTFKTANGSNISDVYNTNFVIEATFTTNSLQGLNDVKGHFYLDFEMVAKDTQDITWTVGTATGHGSIDGEEDQHTGPVSSSPLTKWGNEFLPAHLIEWFVPINVSKKSYAPSDNSVKIVDALSPGQKMAPKHQRDLENSVNNISTTLPVFQVNRAVGSFGKTLGQTSGDAYLRLFEVDYQKAHQYLYERVQLVHSVLKSKNKDEFIHMDWYDLPDPSTVSYPSKFSPGVEVALENIITWGWNELNNPNYAWVLDEILGVSSLKACGYKTYEDNATLLARFIKPVAVSNINSITVTDGGFTLDLKPDAISQRTIWAVYDSAITDPSLETFSNTVTLTSKGSTTRQDSDVIFNMTGGGDASGHDNAITVTKKNPGGEVLPGAMFNVTIYEGTSSTVKFTEDLITNASGFVTTRSLGHYSVNDTIVITETDAPEGYTEIASPVTLHIDPLNNYAVTSCTPADASTDWFTLSANSTGNIQFCAIDQPEVTGIDYTPTATKMVMGDEITLVDDMFNFGIYDAATGTLVSSGKSKADGSIVFEPIHYTAEGTYYYIVRELGPAAPGWTLDVNEYPLTVTVSRVGGALVARDNGSSTFTATEAGAPTSPGFAQGDTYKVIKYVAYTDPQVAAGDFSNYFEFENSKKEKYFATCSDYLTDVPPNDSVMTVKLNRDGTLVALAHVIDSMLHSGALTLAEFNNMFGFSGGTTPAITSAQYASTMMKVIVWDKETDQRTNWDYDQLSWINSNNNRWNSNHYNAALAVLGDIITAYNTPATADPSLSLSYTSTGTTTGEIAITRVGPAAKNPITKLTWTAVPGLVVKYNGATISSGATISDISKPITVEYAGTESLTFQIADTGTKYLVGGTLQGRIMQTSSGQSKHQDLLVTCAQFKSLGGTLVISADSNEDIVFTNRYEKPYTPTNIVLDAQKIVEGDATLTAGMFHFAVFDAVTNEQVATGTNNAAGKITFSPIEFTKPGTYNYYIKETGPVDPDWTLDTRAINVTVTVTAAGDVLTATRTTKTASTAYTTNEGSLGIATPVVTTGTSYSAQEVYPFINASVKTFVTNKIITVKTGSNPTNYGMASDWTCASGNVGDSYALKTTKNGSLQALLVALSRMNNPGSVQADEFNNMFGFDGKSGNPAPITETEARVALLHALNYGSDTDQSGGAKTWSTISCIVTPYGMTQAHYDRAMSVLNGMITAYSASQNTSLSAAYTKTGNTTGEIAITRTGYANPYAKAVLTWATPNNGTLTVKYDGAVINSGAEIGNLSKKVTVEYTGTDTLSFNVQDNMRYIVPGTLKGALLKNSTNGARTDVAIGTMETKFAGGTLNVNCNNDVFVNRYKYTPKSYIIIKGRKLMTGEDLPAMTAGMFHFAMYDKTTNAQVATGTNDEYGVITFTQINYTAEGVYNYYVKEIPPAPVGWTLDTKQYDVKVVVSYINGVLSARSVGDTSSGFVGFSSGGATGPAIIAGETYTVQPSTTWPKYPTLPSVGLNKYFPVKNSKGTVYNVMCADYVPANPPAGASMTEKYSRDGHITALAVALCGETTSGYLTNAEFNNLMGFAGTSGTLYALNDDQRSLLMNCVVWATDTDQSGGVRTWSDFEKYKAFTQDHLTRAISVMTDMIAKYAANTESVITMAYAATGAGKGELSFTRTGFTAKSPKTTLTWNAPSDGTLIVTYNGSVISSGASITDITKKVTVQYNGSDAITFTLSDDGTRYLVPGTLKGMLLKYGEATRQDLIYGTAEFKKNGGKLTLTCERAPEIVFTNDYTKPNEYDAALIKWVSKTTRDTFANPHTNKPLVLKGEDVEYTIRVINQCEEIVRIAEVVDYLPAGLTFTAAKNAGWTQSGSQLIYTGIAGQDIAPGASKDIKLVLTVAATATNATITNWAEIAKMTDASGTVVEDVDSTPDKIDDNDGTAKDNVVDEHRKQSEGTNDDRADEDDHDPAHLQLGGTVHILKLTDIYSQPVVGAKFTIYNSDANGIKGSVYLASTAATGADGKLDVILPAGYYRFEETTFPEYVDPNFPPVFVVQIDASGNVVDVAGGVWGHVTKNTMGGVVYHIAKNTQRGTLRLEKFALGDTIEEDWSNGIIGATFHLYVKNKSTGEYELNYPSSTANYELTTYLGPNNRTIFTNKIRLEPNREYYVKEVVIPAGYDQTKPFNFYFTTDSKDEIASYSIAPESQATYGDVVETSFAYGYGNCADFFTRNVKIVYDLALAKWVNKVGSTASGQDGTQQNPAVVTVKVGDVIEYGIRVTNQGNAPAIAAEITDYVPTGLTFNTAGNAGWTDAGNGKIKLTTTDILQPGQSKIYYVKLTVATSAPVGTTIRNFAEISKETDDKGTAVTDVDSTPDDNKDNDGPVTDNEIGQDGKNGGDEDDHDPADVTLGKIYDLALAKWVSKFDATATGQDGTEINPGIPEVKLGDVVEFSIRITNQGNTAAIASEITDYIPSDLKYEAANNTGLGWTVSGSMAKRTTTDILQPGESKIYKIYLTVENTAVVGDYIINWAEISKMTDDKGAAVTDVDSTPDDNNGNDGTCQDNVISGDHKKNSGDDEDDHDKAIIVVKPIYDMALAKWVNKIGSTASGQDGTQQNPAIVTVKVGDVVEYGIRVTNQGNIAAIAAEITDYVPTGLTFNTAGNTGWTDAGSGKIKLTTTDILQPGESKIYYVKLTVATSAPVGTTIRNWAEISKETNDRGGDVTDIDSTPDDNSTNDNFGGDNEIGQDGKKGGDEDDHDPADITLGKIYDLALAKWVSKFDATVTGQTGTEVNPAVVEVKLGDVVEFSIRITNQGNSAAIASEITDYIPTGLKYEAANNTGLGWTVSGSMAKRATTDILQPGESKVYKIYLTAENTAAVNTEITNWAEISKMTDDKGGAVTDVDSTPDDNNGNDGTCQDNVISGDHKKNSGDDEDDHDKAVIKVKPIYDLALAKWVNKIGSTASGQDGTQQNPAVVTVKVGDVVEYGIRVTNQGNIAAIAAEITDYVPTGLTFNTAGNAGWTDAGSGKIKLTTTDILQPGQSKIYYVKLTVATDAPVGTTIRNFAEISKETDDKGGNVTDIDSTPDDNKDNDGPVTDNEIGQDGKNGGDEDDHDPADITLGKIYDLALAKWVSKYDVTETGQTGTETNPAVVEVAVGNVVEFSIRISNQGNSAAIASEITDYIPTGLKYEAANNTGLGWTVSGSMAKRTTTDILQPGESKVYKIYLTVEDTAAINTFITNWAEISKMTDDKGGVVTDVDSTPDDDNGNDGTCQDNVISGDHKKNSGDDEDDHDKAVIKVKPIYDLALVKWVDRVGNTVTGQDGTQETPAIVKVKKGDVIEYGIRVYNQGNIKTIAAEITDYIPAGLKYEAANNTLNWTVSGSYVKLTTTDVINPGESKVYSIALTVEDTAAVGTAIRNFAEISKETDEDGDDVDDEDSTPDDNPDNDGNPKDNEKDNEDGDEDDHDPADVEIDRVYDAALIKWVSKTVRETFAAPHTDKPFVIKGEDVEFTIRVTNQCEEIIRIAEVVDYLPAGLSFTAAKNTGWTQSGSQLIYAGLAGQNIAVGDSKDIKLVLTVANTATSANITNWAEIAKMTDAAGTVVDDIDSTPDKISNNDGTAKDNVVDEHHKLPDGTIDNSQDEDDHDLAELKLGGVVRIKKISSEGSMPVAGAHFKVYAADAQGQTGALIGTYGPTDANGYMEVMLPEGYYYFIESTVPAEFDPNFLVSFTVHVGSDGSVTQSTGDWGHAYMGFTSESNPGVIAKDTVWSHLRIGKFAKGDTVASDWSNGIVGATFHLYVFNETTQQYELNTFGTTPAHEFTTVLQADNTIATTRVWLRGNKKYYVKEVTIPTGYDQSAPFNFYFETNARGEVKSYSVAPESQANYGTVLETSLEYGYGKSASFIARNIKDRYDLALAKWVNKVGETVTGQNGTQQSPAVVAVQKGSVIEYGIRVTNQGNKPAIAAEITDYVPTGLTFNAADNTGWVDAGNGKIKLTTTDVIQPGASMIYYVKLTVANNAPVGTNIRNLAEISKETDEEGEEVEDDDSTPDDNKDNDGDPKDNEIDEDGEDGRDEDDHDPADVIIGEVYDLALAKWVSQYDVDKDSHLGTTTGQDGTEANPAVVEVRKGDIVEFSVRITNQGNKAAIPAEITDYIPAGLKYEAANNTGLGWTVSGSVAKKTVTDILQPGDTKIYKIYLTVENTAAIETTITNWAEISKMTNDVGTAVEDIDSTPDDNNGNDGTCKDNVIDEDRKSDNSKDEDDHDKAEIKVKPIYDMALVKWVDKVDNVATGQDGTQQPPEKVKVKLGSVIEYGIRVYNQGDTAAIAAEITDYIPAGLTFNTSGNPGWTDAGNGKIKLTTTDVIQPGGSKVYTVKLTVAALAPVGTVIRNLAEISKETDDDGDDVDDEDSDPDDDPENDGDPKDNEKDNDDDDEDDHDPADVEVDPVYDLALAKWVNKVGATASGQDGTQQNPAVVTVKVGDVIEFGIRVTNQGNVPAIAAEITDYVPTGLTFNTAGNTGWTDAGNGKVKLTTTDVIQPGQSKVYTIKLTVANDAPVGTNIRNFAEISKETDKDGEEVEDVDSNADDDDTNDGPVKDNEIDEDGKNGGDEDDHDPADVIIGKVYDLALAKWVSKYDVSETGQTGTEMNPAVVEVALGDVVEFSIRISNQGNTAAIASEITDYIPTGLKYEAANNTGLGWTVSGSKAKLTTTDILQPGATKVYKIYLTVEDTAAIDTYITNYAEISAMTDDKDQPVTDVDSTPDDNNGNDGTCQDNVISGDHKSNTNDDEDDHDKAVIKVKPIYDLALAKWVSQFDVDADTHLGTATGQAGTELNPAVVTVSLGDIVEFSVRITNQGNTAAIASEIADYIPAGLKFEAANNAGLGWTVSGSIAKRTTTDILQPGESKVYKIYLTVEDTAVVDSKITNYAEISKMTDDKNAPVTDIDSTPDADDSNDGACKDNVIDEDGKNKGGDEDDHDKAEIIVGKVYDMALVKWVDTVDGTLTGQDGTQQPPVKVKVKLGSVIEYGIRVYNQGNTPAIAAEITDYLPTGLTFNAADNDGWVDAGNGKIKLTTDDVIQPGASKVYFVKLTVAATAPVGTTIRNLAEISKETDPDGEDVDDEDSDPDDDPENDGDPKDNEKDNDDDDEDDHDPADVEVEPIYDLALVKWVDKVGGTATTQDGTQKPGATETVKVNDVVEFGLRVTNQGNIATKVKGLVDYLPEGLTFNADDNTDWVDAGNGLITLATDDLLQPGASKVYTIKLTVSNTAQVAVVISNFAEISAMSDKDDKPVTDIDSTPDTDDANDGSVVDNEIGQNGKEGGDEDDHDVAKVVLGEIYDLALAKWVSVYDIDWEAHTGTPSGQDGTETNPETPEVIRGSLVEFSIRITNQGNTAAIASEITDYIPTGLVYEADKNTAHPWNVTGNTAKLATTDVLQPGETKVYKIMLTVDDTAAIDTYITNYAEISEMTDEDGNPVDDVDSTPDDDNGNDGTVKDNVIDENHKDDSSDDEDDHDQAIIYIKPVYDLALVKWVNGVGASVEELQVTGQNGQPHDGKIEYVHRGDIVEFKIRVTNQGDTAAKANRIDDVAQSWLSFLDAEGNPLNGPEYDVLPFMDNASVLTTNDLLQPGESIEYTVYMRIKDDAPYNMTIENIAAIDEMRNAAGEEVDDIDSTPGADHTNDRTIKDNVIHEHIKFNADHDADDHDPAGIMLLPTVEITGSKAVEGTSSVARTFTYNLVEVTDETGATVKTDGRTATDTTVMAGDFSFTLIDLEEGTYYFAISETDGGVGGWTYDDTVYVVKVEVELSDGSEPVVTIVKGDDEIVFTNTYEHTPTDIVLEAEKNVVGEDAVMATFEFAVYDEDNNEVATGTNDATGHIAFSAIEFTAPGVYAFTIKETTANGNGWTTDLTVRNVTVNVVDNGDGTLTATAVYPSGSLPQFTNNYGSNTSFVPQAKKTAVTDNGESYPLTNGQFEFTLYDHLGNVIETKTNDGNGDITFTAITYTKDGTYSYTIKETSTGGNGWSVDSSEKHVTVTVVDNGDGTKTATADYASGGTIPTFVNSYTTEPGSAVIVAKKIGLTAEGDSYPVKAGQFEFTLYDQDNNELATVTNDADGNIIFPAQTYTLQDVGSHAYTIKETSTTVSGWTLDTTTKGVSVKVEDNGDGTLTTTVEYANDTVPVFTNTYGAGDTLITPVATKTVSGDDSWLDAGQFTFGVFDEDDNEVSTGTNDADGNVIFTSISYGLEDVGEHAYTIRETSDPADHDGWTLNTVEHTFTVTVVDNEDGTLTATVKYPNDLTPNFTNSYDNGDTTFTPEAVKTSNGRSLANGQFTFGVFENGVEVSTGTNNAAGVITFDPITYQAAGKHDYIIKETSDPADHPGWTLDTHEYALTVTVVDNKDGTLTATGVYADGTPPVFVNNYDADGIDITLQATKRGVDSNGDKQLTDGQFEFAVYEDGVVTPIVTGTNDADGRIIFPVISYTLDDIGVHNYTIVETSQSGDGWTVDPLGRNVTVTVSDNGDGTLSAVIAYGGGSAPEFVNSYTTGPTSVVINAKKNATGRPVSDKTFSFAVYDENDEVVATGTNDAAGNIAFTSISYNFEDVGSHAYTIRETSTSGSGWTVDLTARHVSVDVVDNEDGTLTATINYENDIIPQFNNSYTTAPTSIVLEAVKKAADDYPLPDQRFSFAVYDENDEEVATGTNDADGNITFTAIEYDFEDVGEHAYTIKEISGGGAGWTMSDLVRHVTVTVVDNADGTLTATKVYENDLVPVFTNSYTTGPISIAFEAVKLTQGRPVTDEQFEFGVFVEGETEPLVTAKNDAAGNVTFPAIEYDFDDVGSHAYIIKEISASGDGWTVSDIERHVSVTVVDNGDGTLTATKAYENNITPVFTNSYTTEPTSIVLEAVKATTPEAKLTADKFEFGVFIEGEDDPIVTAKNDAAGNINFPAITYQFEDVGEHAYLIKEITQSGSGWTVDGTARRVTVTVVDNADGTLTATKVYENDLVPVFHNSYTTDPTSITFEAVKTADGRALVADQFEFGVFKEGETEPVVTAKNDAGGNVLFDAITYNFEDVGTHTYTIKEISASGAGWTVSNLVRSVTVTVVDNDNGTLTATKVYENDIIPTFHNSYTTEPTSIVLEAVKQTQGRPLVADKFEFGVFKVGETEPLVTAKNGAAGTITFPAIPYNFEDVGQHEYIIKELSDSGLGWTIDATEKHVTVTVVDNGNGTLTATKAYETGAAPVFVNSYTTPGTSIAVSAFKQGEGRDIAADQFEFAIFDKDGTQVGDSVKNDAAGNITFGAIHYEFEDVGVHDYTIREISAGGDGWTVDSSHIPFTVTITDNGDGTLTATSDITSTPTFVNSYTTEPTSIVLLATKKTEGRALAADQFEFGVFEGMVKVASGKNKANGDVVFSQITYNFDDVGLHTYTIRETSTSGEGWTVDDLEAIVTVEVKDNGDGTLTATADYGEDNARPIFINTYEPAPAKAQLEAKKVVTGTTLGSLTFDFTLFYGDQNVIEVVQNDASGAVKFAEITYDKPGEHTYYIRETSTEKTGWKYDFTAHTVTVKVTDDGKGQLVAAVAYKDNKVPTITNVYTPTTITETPVPLPDLTPTPTPTKTPTTRPPVTPTTPTVIIPTPLVPKEDLPKTGGVTMLFLAILGTALMASGIVVAKDKKKKSN